MMRGGGEGVTQAVGTLGLVPIGPVDQYMPKKNNEKKNKKIQLKKNNKKCPRPSASAEYIKPISTTVLLPDNEMSRWV